MPVSHSSAHLLDPDSPSCSDAAYRGEGSGDEPPAGDAFLCDECHQLREDVREREDRDGTLHYVCDTCATDPERIDQLIEGRRS